MPKQQPLTPEERKDIGRGMLGDGLAGRAADSINSRKSRLDQLEEEAMGNSPGQADRTKFNWDNSPPKRY